MIEARDLRVDADGSPCVDGLSFASSAERTLVLGAPRELMLACAGLVPIVRGSLTIEGEPPQRAMALGRITACPLDAPLPPTWSPLAYVEWSARLTGLSRKEAREAAETALAHMGLALPLIKQPLRRHATVVRRATQIAAALVPSGATLVMWDPLQDLEPEVAASFAPTLVRALGAVRSVVFAARAPLDGPFASAMKEVVVLSGSRVVAQGPVLDVAARGRRFLVRAVGDVDRFAAALTARGAQLAPGTRSAPHEALAVELGSMENADVFRAALEADAVVVEMRPLAAAFS